MKRGEIWWASMSEPRGSEPGYRRPVVIVSANAFNESNIQTVIVAIITSNLHFLGFASDISQSITSPEPLIT